MTTTAFTLTPGSVHVRWGGNVRSVPALAVDGGNGRVYGAPARDAPDPIDVTALVDAAAVGTETELALLLSGLVGHAATVVGAPGADRAFAVHPTWWNERRRDLFVTAVRQVAADAIPVPIAVAARCAAGTAAHERCVVLEFAARGVTAVRVGSAGLDGSAVERVARDPDLSVHSSDAAARLASLLMSVSDGPGPDAVLVTGGPGEPSGVELLALVDDLVGAGQQVVPVAASEMLVSLTGSGAVGPVPAPVISSAATSVPDEQTLPWLREVRARPDPSRAGHGRRNAMFVAGVVIPALLAGAVFLWAFSGAGREDAESSSRSEAGAAETVPVGDADPQDPDRAPSKQFGLGRVRLELPGDWRIRDPETAHSGRVELVPAGGADRRIVVAYRVLADGIDEQDVASELAVRAGERAPVIRDLDADTTFADRKVVSYLEVPDEYSVVRWSVMAFPGLQVSVGCQYLEGEWRRIRSECEQAVHTLRIG